MAYLIGVKEELGDISIVFAEFLCDLLYEAKLDKVNMVGIGNSISGGWTAVDNDVCPLINKLGKDELSLIPACQLKGVNIKLASFALIGDNSNKKIYDKLFGNPSLNDIREHFTDRFDFWKNHYANTPFANFVDRDVALGYYPDSDDKFKDFYDDDTLTITSFNGCTGKFLERSLHYFLGMLVGNWKFLDEEIKYLCKILEYLISLSRSSYITVGNFPHLTSNYLSCLNRIVDEINRKITGGISDFDQSRVMYFDGINLELINHINGKIKIDNHPSLYLQYASLCHYLLFLMMNLPASMSVPSAKQLTDKYAGKIRTLKREKGISTYGVV